VLPEDRPHQVFSATAKELRLYDCKLTSSDVSPWPKRPNLGIHAVAQSLESATLAEVTAEIVSAYVSNNKIAPTDLPTLISTVGHEMVKIGNPVELPAEEKTEPAVSVRRSIQPNHLICLLCGKPQKILKRHIAVQHDLTPAQYRERFGLKPDYPMTAPNYVQQRREIALRIGLGKPKKPAQRGKKGSARPRATEKGERRSADAGK
jgi:predicted transcriptional regulator